jgi:hypothetical protein
MGVGFGGFRWASVALLCMLWLLPTEEAAGQFGNARVKPTVKPGIAPCTGTLCREAADQLAAEGEGESAAEESPAEEAPAEEAPAEEAAEEEASEEPAEEEYSEESAEEESAEESSDDEE